MLNEKNKKINRLTLKHILFIITYTIAMVWIIMNINTVIGYVSSVASLLQPFIFGIALAFIFNLPMKFFMRKLPDSLKRFKKSVALLLSLCIFIFVILFIIQIVVPQLVSSVTSLLDSLPGYIDSLEKMFIKAIDNEFIPEEVAKQLTSYSSQMENMIISVVKNVLPHVISFIVGLVSSLTNIVLTLVVAVYVTVSKEKLVEQVKKFLYAFTPQHVNIYILKVGRITNTTFSAFVTGQLLEAIIIGVLCYVASLIFGFPYAPILGVIIGVTNIIPIFGAIFGTGLCAILVAFVNPIQGLLFLIFGVCLQQFESNLIYPRVVGTSIGLSGLWVLFAITIGGGLFGFFGMLLGLPTFSVFYTLLREEMNRRVKVKQEKDILLDESI